MSEILARAVEFEPRAIVAAEYRLCCSPHEWTDEDSLAMAQFTFAARDAMLEMRKDADALMRLLAHERSKTALLKQDVLDVQDPDWRERYEVFVLGQNGRLAEQVVGLSVQVANLKKLIPEPSEPGSFVGDAYYPAGGTEHSHVWNGQKWLWRDDLKGSDSTT